MDIERWKEKGRKTRSNDYVLIHLPLSPLLLSLSLSLSLSVSLIYINSLSVDDNICSPMGVELSGEGIAGRRLRNAKLFERIEHSGSR